MIALPKNEPTDNQERSYDGMIVRHLGNLEYVESLKQMQTFCRQRAVGQEDEIWLVQHPPVYTLGLNRKRQHLPHTPNNIALVQSDRGGDITYHGPGQIVAYTLLDIQRRNWGAKRLVLALQNAVLDFLDHYGINGQIIDDSPGVYVDHKKIASLGLRIKNGFSYHGIAINIDMDLGPFSDIHPCGYEGLCMCQLSDFVAGIRPEETQTVLLDHLHKQLF